ncbi:MAG: class I adenylate-forming enzyme family protein [Phycisphaerales bacterium]
MSVHWPIIRRCLQRPLEVGIVDDRRAYRRIDVLAAALIVADELERVSQSKVIGVMLPTSGAMPIAALAGWMLGRTVVPLNYLLKPEELQYVIDDCRPDTIVTTQPLLEHMGGEPARAHLVRIEELDFKSVPTPRWPALVSDADLACLLYTSGTSGKPKGVMLSHGNLATNVRQCVEWVNFTRAEVVLGVLPQFHSFGLTVLTLLPLMLGCKAVYTARFVPGKIVKLFREHRATAFVAIPSMYNALMQVKDGSAEDFKSLRYAVSGGEPLPEVVAKGFRERFGVTIAEGYGLTETSPVTNWCRPHEYRPHSVGRALPGVRERIVSMETGADVGAGVDGEVRISGPNVMKGYYGLPKESAACRDEEGYFRTGDIGRMDADGHLYITGRLKEMLIIGGENVFPREIEEVLNAHPSVKDSGVIGTSDPMRGELPLAFVELKEGERFDQQSILTHCRGRLAGYKVPTEVRHLEALPRNPTGKVMRRELKALANPK